MMIHLFTVIRNDNDSDNIYEHGFYSNINGKFYGYIDEYCYFALEETMCYLTDEFVFELPKKLNIKSYELNVNNRYYHFMCELEKIIFDKI